MKELAIQLSALGLPKAKTKLLALDIQANHPLFAALSERHGQLERNSGCRWVVFLSLAELAVSVFAIILVTDRHISARTLIIISALLGASFIVFLIVLRFRKTR